MDTNFLLIGTIALLVVCSLYGYSKGFLRMAVSLVSLVVILMVVPYISPYISDFLINKTPVYENVKQRISETIADGNVDFQADNPNGENQEQTIKSLDLPEIITEVLIENNTEEVYDSLSTTIFQEYVSGYLAKVVVNSGSFIGLVAVLWVGIYLLLFAVDILNKIPVLRTFNKLLGLGTGLVIGLAIIWIGFLAVISFFGEEISSEMLKDVQASSLLTYLFNVNPLFEYIK